LLRFLYFNGFIVSNASKVSISRITPRIFSDHRVRAGVYLG
jgi:hypothetical protein